VALYRKLEATFYEIRGFKSGCVCRPTGVPASMVASTSYDNWQKNGAATIEQVRVDDPSTHLKVVAQVLPKEFVMKQESIDDLSDEELLDIIATLRHLAAENRVIEGRANLSSEGVEEAPGREP